MENEIYKFLKENNLTDKDEATFLEEYSAPEKAKELYGFFKENELTTKTDVEFYDQYLKKKVGTEPIQPDLGSGGTVGASGVQSTESKGGLFAPLAFSEKLDEKTLQVKQTPAPKGKYTLEKDGQIANVTREDIFKNIDNEEFLSGIQSGEVNIDIQDDAELFNLLNEKLSFYKAQPIEPKVATQEDIDFWESAGNSIKNVFTTLKGFFPRADVLAADVYENILGKEIAQGFYKWTGADIDKTRNNAYAKLAELEKQMLPTRGLVESAQKKDLAGIAAGTVDAVSAIFSTALPSLATGGAGLVTEMIGGTVVDYNNIKAEEQGVSVEELYQKGDAELATPMIIGSAAVGLESIGLKGIGRYINQNIRRVGTKRIADLFLTFKKEGLTEWTQTGLEEANKVLAKGGSVDDASRAAADVMLSEKGLESYLKGGVGATSTAIAGRFIKGKYNAITKKNKEQTDKLQKEAEVAKQIANNPTVSKEAKQAVSKEVQETEAAINEIQKQEINTYNSIEDKTEIDNLINEKNRLETIIRDESITEEQKQVFSDKLNQVNTQIDNIFNEKLKEAEKLASEQFRELEKEKIADLAQRISKGEKIESAEDLQLQQNFPKELEAELLKIKESEPTTTVGEPIQEEVKIPINERKGESVTVNIGGKAISGIVEVDEGGKAQIVSGNQIFELPTDIEYAEYVSPVRIADDGSGIEYNGNVYSEVRFDVNQEGQERVALIKDDGTLITVTNPVVVEELKYQSALAIAQELSEQEANNLINEYESERATTKTTQEGVSEVNREQVEQTEQEVRLQEAIAEIELLEQIALEQISDAESGTKLVQFKPKGSKDAKVYSVTKNADGTYSATLNGKKVVNKDVLKALETNYENTTKKQVDALIPQLQEQLNQLKQEVENKLFGVTPKTETDAVQKQTAGQVPIQPEARISEEVEERTPEAEPKEVAEEEVKPKRRKRTESEKEQAELYKKDRKDLLSSEPSDFFEYVMLHFLRGGKVDLRDMARELGLYKIDRKTGEKKLMLTETRPRVSFWTIKKGKSNPSVIDLANKLASEYEFEYGGTIDEQDARSAVIEVLSNYATPAEIHSFLADKYKGKGDVIIRFRDVRADRDYYSQFDNVPEEMILTEEEQIELQNEVIRNEEMANAATKEDIDKIAKEYDEYYDTLTEEEKQEELNKIEQYGQQTESTPIDEFEIVQEVGREEGATAIREDEKAKRQQEANRKQAEREYNEELEKIEKDIEAAKKSKQKKLDEISGKPELFAEEAKANELFGVKQDFSKEAIDRIMKPFNEKIASLEKQKADFIANKENYLTKYDKQEGIDFKEQSPEEIAKKSLIDKIQDLKIKGGDKTGALMLAPKLWNGFLDVVITGLKAGEVIGNAVKKGIDWLNSQGVTDVEPYLNELEIKAKEPSVKQAVKKLIPRKPTEQKRIDRAAAIGEGLGFIAGEITGIKKGIKEGTTRHQEAIKNITDLVKDAFKNKTIDSRTYNSVINRIGKAKTPLQIERAMDYIEKVADDASYIEALTDVNNMQSKAKALSKQKNIPINHRQVLEGISKIDIDLIEDLAGFRDKLNDYMRNFLPITNPNYKPADSAEMLSYLDNLQKETNRAYENQLKALYGVESEGLSAKEILDAIEAEDIDEYMANMSETKRNELTKLLTKLAEYAKLGLDTISIEGLNEKEKTILEKIKNIPIEKLSNNQKKEFTKVADNISLNKKFFGAEKIAALSDALLGMPKALSNAKGIKVRKALNVRGLQLEQQIFSISDMFRNFFGIGEAMAKVQNDMGMGKLIMGQRRYVKEMKKAQLEISDFFKSLKKKYKDFNSKENKIAEGMAGYLIQPVPNQDELNSFQIRKDIVFKDLQEKAKYKETSEQANIGMEVFSKLEKAKNNKELFDILKKEFPSAFETISFYKDKLLPKYKEQIQQHQELFFNNYADWSNQEYLPIAYTKVPGEKIKDGDEQYFQSSTIPTPKQSPNTIRRSAYTTLPKDRLINYNLRANTFNALTKDMYDLNTAYAWQQMKDFMSLPEAEILFGGKDNVNFVNKKLNNLRSKQQKTGIIDSDEFSKTLEGMSNVARRYAVSALLGGVFQAPKQMSEQVVSAAINNNFRFDKIGKNMLDINQAKDLLDKFGIGGRKEIRGGTTYDNAIESGSSAMQQWIGDGKAIKAKEVLEKLEDVWMKSLTQGDYLAASSAWMTFYESYLNKKGIEITDWKNEADLVDTDPTRMDAAVYAETMTDITQVSSDTSKLADISKKGRNGYENVIKTILLPFSTFAVQMRARMINDAKDIFAFSDMEGRSRVSASKSLLATIAGMAAFHSMNIYLLGMVKDYLSGLILNAFGIDDTEDEEEAKKQAAFKFKMFYSNMMRDLMASGFGQIAENGFIDAMNWTAFMILAQLDDPSTKKKNGETMDYKYWKSQTERTPFYRYGQWEESAFGLGLYDFVLEKPKAIFLQGEKLATEEIDDKYKPLILFASISEMLHSLRLNDADVNRIIQQAQKRALKQTKQGAAKKTAKQSGEITEGEITEENIEEAEIKEIQ